MYRDKVKGQSHTVTLHTPITAGAGTSGQTCLPRTGSKETAHQEHGDVITGGVTDVHHKPHRYVIVMYASDPKERSDMVDLWRTLCYTLTTTYYLILFDLHEVSVYKINYTQRSTMVNRVRPRLLINFPCILIAIPFLLILYK